MSDSALSGSPTERKTFEAPAFSSLGTPRSAVALPAELFDGTVNVPVMHQAVKAFLANQRQGNAATKIRKYVTGGNQKPWKQKGTGRARQGSIRAPQWVGGGTVFGPTPRSYAQYVPRQVRALARKSALNARAREDAVKVIDAFHYEAPSTRELVQLLRALRVADQKVLILTDGTRPNVYLSARNLRSVHVMPYSDVSTYHLLWSDVVLIEAAAIGQPLEPLADDPGTAASGRARSERPARSAGSTERAVRAPKAAAKSTHPAAAAAAAAGGTAKRAKKGGKKTTRKAGAAAAAARGAPRAATRAAAKKAPPKKKKGK